MNSEIAQMGSPNCQTGLRNCPNGLRNCPSDGLINCQNWYRNCLSCLRMVQNGFQNCWIWVSNCPFGVCKIARLGSEMALASLCFQDSRFWTLGCWFLMAGHLPLTLSGPNNFNTRKHAVHSFWQDSCCLSPTHSRQEIKQ